MALERAQLITLIAGILSVTEEEATAFADADGDTGATSFKDLSKKTLKEKLDEGHKKGMKKATETLVSKLKNTFDVDIDVENPDEIATALKEHLNSEGAAELTDETVKAHPAYKELQSELNKKEKDQNKLIEKKVKELVSEKENEFKAGLKKESRKSIDARLEIEAERWLTENKAVLSTDPAKKRKQIGEIVAKLRNDDIEIDEDGDFVLSDAEGKPILNAKGKTATLHDRFGDFDYLYTFQTTQQRSSSNIDPKKTGGGNPTFTHFKGDVPTTEAEMDVYRTKYFKKQMPKEEFKEVEAAYIASQQS